MTRRSRQTSSNRARQRSGDQLSVPPCTRIASAPLVIPMSLADVRRVQRDLHHIPDFAAALVCDHHQARRHAMRKWVILSAVLLASAAAQAQAGDAGSVLTANG